MNSGCNVKTAVIFTAIISAFGASLSVSISAYGVSKNTSNYIYVRDHSFSTYANFSVKLTFLPPDRHTYVCVSRDKKR